MRLFPQLGVEIAVAIARREYPARVEAARRARGRGPAKRNSVNYVFD